MAGLERLLGRPRRIEESSGVATVGRPASSPTYELTENYKKWAEALETLSGRGRAARAPGAPAHPGRSATAGRSTDNVSAFLTAIRIFELEPHDARDPRAPAGAWPPRWTAPRTCWTPVRRVLKRVEEPGFRRELLAYQAEIDEKRPGRRRPRPRRVYQEILALDPLHFGAYRALTRLYRDAERWIDLRKLLEVRQENLPEPKERLTLLWQMAEIDEALLEDRHARHRGAADRSPRSIPRI